MMAGLKSPKSSKPPRDENFLAAMRQQHVAWVFIQGWVFLANRPPRSGNSKTVIAGLPPLLRGSCMDSKCGLRIHTCGYVLPRMRRF